MKALLTMMTRPKLYLPGIFCLLGLLATTPLLATIQVTSVTPRTGLRCNGAIEILVNGEAGPFEIYVEDDDEFYLESGVNDPNPVSFPGLCGGDYTITVYDLFGCETVISVTVEICGAKAPVSLIELVNASAPNRPDGSLTVAVNSPEEYTYVWSTGATGPHIKNLFPGSYSVTATNSAGCTRFGRFEVSACNEPVSPQDCFSLDDPNETFDECEFPVTEPVWSEFEAQLEVENGGLVLDGQQTITFSVLVKENGNSIFTSPSLDRYAIRWIVNGEEMVGSLANLTLNVGDLFGQSASAQIKAIVSNGCTSKILSADPIIECGTSNGDEMLSDFFIKVLNYPCQGTIIENGSYNLIIPNPNGEVVSVNINGEAQNVGTGDPVITFIDEVSAGSYNIDIAIGACVKSFTFTMPYRVPELVYQSYDQDYCYFNQTCDGNNLGTYQVPIEFSVEEAGNYPGCVYPVKCNGVVYATEDVKIRVTRAADFQNLFNYYNANNLVLEDYYNLHYWGGNACHFLAYCPTSMRIVGHSGQITKPTDTRRPPSEGCSITRCVDLGVIVSYHEFCASDLTFLPLSIRDLLVQSINSCDPVEVNYFELIQAYRNGSFNHIDLTELFNSDLYEKVISKNLTEIDPRAKCATVRFCQSDLTVLYNDIEEVDCGLIIPPDDYCNTNSIFELDENFFQPRITCEAEEYEYDENLTPEQNEFLAQVNPVIRDENGNIIMEKILCEVDPYSDPEDNCYIEKIIDYEFTIDLPNEETLIEQANQGVEIIKKYDTNAGLLEELQRFGWIKFQGDLFPFGIFRSPTNTSKTFYKNYVYHFVHDSKRTLKEELGQTRLSIQDWDTQQFIFCDSIADDPDLDQEYSLNYDDQGSRWEKGLVSDLELAPMYLDKTDSEFYLGGTFRGNLFFSENSLINSADAAVFVLQIGFDGTVNGMYTINGVDLKRKDLQFTKMRSGETIITGRYQGGQLTVNGTAMNMASNSGFFVLSMSSSGQLVLTQDIPANINSRICAVDVAEDASQFTIAYNNPAIPNTAQINNQLIIKTIDNNGLELWSKSIYYSGDQLKAEDLAIAYGKETKLFLGLTYQNGLTAFDTTLTGVGGDDIAIFELDGTNGDKIENLTYGSEDDETVSLLWYNNGVLYFAGEMRGKKQVRQIGNYKFINWDYSLQRTYMSYIFEEEPSLPQETAKTNLPPTYEDKAPVDLINEPDFKVYPNPFNRSLTVEINSRKAQSIVIRMTDLLGKTVYSKTDEVIEVGTNQISLNILADLPEGVYTLQVDGEDGTSFGSRRVVHMSGN
jgi:hypothetical protein